MTETFLTVEEAARRLAVTPYTMREWLKTGKVRGIQVSRRWRVPERALSELASATPTRAPENATKNATAGHLTDFLTQVEALSQRLEAAGFKGVNGAEIVREGREERERQLGE